MKFLDEFLLVEGFVVHVSCWTLSVAGEMAIFFTSIAVVAFLGIMIRLFAVSAE